MVLQGIRALLQRRYEIVGLATDGRALIRAAEQLQPNMVLLETAMPVVNGIEAAGQIRKLVPQTKVIFVTMSEDSASVHEALSAGASGYVLKRAAVKDLTTAIEEVSRGRT